MSLSGEGDTTSPSTCKPGCKLIKSTRREPDLCLRSSWAREENLQSPSTQWASPCFPPVSSSLPFIPRSPFSSPWCVTMLFNALEAHSKAFTLPFCRGGNARVGWGWGTKKSMVSSKNFLVQLYFNLRFTPSSNTEENWPFQRAQTSTSE